MRASFHAWPAAFDAVDEQLDAEPVVELGVVASDTAETPNNWRVFAGSRAVDKATACDAPTYRPARRNRRG
jgi:hypothetical protein